MLLIAIGTALSAGFLQSAEYLSSAIEAGASTEQDLMRTDINSCNATTTGAKIILVAVENTGQTKLGGFTDWDVIAEYYDEASTFHSSWLPYAGDSLNVNEWKDGGIYYGQSPEVFEPGLLNTGEYILLELVLEPLPAWNTTVTIWVSAPTGATASIDCPIIPGDFELTPHGEFVDIAGGTFYELKSAMPSDGAGTTLTTPNIGRYETGRWLLYDTANATMYGRCVYPLEGISVLPAYTWEIYYRAYATTGWLNNPYIDMDIVVRQADGTVREIIAEGVGPGYIASYGSWQTVTGTYDFTGYEVVDDSDYLEVDFYANVDGRGSNRTTNSIRILIDDVNLPIEDQTRIR